MRVKDLIMHCNNINAGTSCIVCDYGEEIEYSCIYELPRRIMNRNLSAFQFLAVSPTAAGPSVLIIYLESEEITC